MTIRYAIWARSESEAARLQALGFRPSEGCLAMHHAAWAILHIYDGELTDAIRAMFSETKP